MSDPMMRVAEMDYVESVNAGPTRLLPLDGVMAEAFEAGWVGGIAAERGRRKVVQITTMPSSGRVEAHVIALCNDGAILVRFPAGSDPDTWFEMSAIPQPGDAP